LFKSIYHITSFSYFSTHDRNFGETLHISVTLLISVFHAYTFHIR